MSGVRGATYASRPGVLYLTKYEEPFGPRTSQHSFFHTVIMHTHNTYNLRMKFGRTPAGTSLS